MCYIGGMSAARQSRGAGRPTKLTDEVQAKVVRVVKMGGSLVMAARYAGVSVDAVYEWVRRGEGQHERGSTPRFVRFAQAVRQAEGDGDAELLESVRAQVVGLECKACVDGVVEHQDKGPIQCPACRGTTYATKPDGRLSLDVLARRHPADFGRKDRMQVEQKVSGSVRVDVQVKALTMSLQALDAAQLMALAWGGEEPKAIEAGEE